MSVFKAYDIRGIYPDELNEELARRIGYAFATFLAGRRFVVGRDMRTSAEPVARAAAEGMMAAGANVIDIGMVTTPMSYFAIGHLGTDGGVCTTASHNPAQYIGFKLSRAEAKPMSRDTGIADLERLVDEPQPEVAPRGHLEERDLLEDYLKHVLSFKGELRKLRVVVDAGNGTAGVTVPALFEQLPCDLIPLYMEPDGSFPNHEANPLKEENLEDLKRAVLEHNADLGVAYDGDADRAAFVDEKATTVPCDLVTALIAREALRDHPGRAVVYDLRSSWVVPEEVEKAGGKPVRDRVGHSFMKATLRRENGLFGGELSGHYYFADNFFSDSADIAVLRILSLMSREGKKLSALIQPLRRYFPTGEINFVVEDKDGAIQKLAETFSDGKIDYLDGITVQYDDWWFNVRKSNTEPLLRLNLEAKTRDGMHRGRDRVMALLGDPE